MKYNISLEYNGEIKKKRTENVREGILSLAPKEAVYTEAFFTIQRVGKKDKVERMLNLRQARQLFNNENFLDAFLGNLQLEYGTL
jgi:hypothetical protein